MHVRVIHNTQETTPSAFTSTTFLDQAVDIKPSIDSVQACEIANRLAGFSIPVETVLQDDKTLQSANNKEEKKKKGSKRKNLDEVGISTGLPLTSCIATYCLFAP